MQLTKLDFSGLHRFRLSRKENNRMDQEQMKEEIIKLIRAMQDPERIELAARFVRRLSGN